MSNKRKTRNKELLHIRKMVQSRNEGFDGELEKRYEKYRGILENLTIMSDVFMRNVLKKQECTEYILRVIMGKKDLQLIDQVLQKDYKNLQGRSAILDCIAVDAERKRYNIEIQQDTRGASPERARYHSSLMDVNMLEAGHGFEELPESYVIFITRNDALRNGLPIFHVKRKIEETGEDFGDRSHIIYVNAACQEDTELGRLMHDLNCKEAEKMHSTVLAQRVRELKETKKGVEMMCQEMDQIYSEGAEYGREYGRQEGIEIGEMKKARETALSLAHMGMSPDKIAQAVGVSPQKAEDWIREGNG